MVAHGIPFLIKLGECAHGRGIAMVWYTPRHGEEPPKHVHDSEDEVFYIQRAVDVCVKKASYRDCGVIVLPAGILLLLFEDRCCLQSDTRCRRLHMVGVGLLHTWNSSNSTVS